MLKKLKIILVFASLSITLCLMSNTYSRYVATSQGNVDLALAKWQILLNKTDISSGGSSNMNFTPTIETNNNVAADKVAPSSKGYFDIEIDPTNVDVSFKYSISLGFSNNNIPDLIITKYAILPASYKTGDELQYTTISNSKIENTLSYTNSAFNKFTIRIFFEWYEGANEQMNNQADTNAANSANTTFKINANIKFEQVI